MKQEITSKEFSSLGTVKGTAEGFTKPILQEYAVIFCIVRQNSNSVKSSFHQKNVEVEQGPVIPSLFVLLR